MIKGVNKQIVEINNTNSIFFERAVFYLRPCVRELPPEIAREEAEKYIALIENNYDTKNKYPHRHKFLIPAFAVSAAGTAIYFLVRAIFL